jgi:ATPase family AAA domain-containing protein 3A/B
VNTSECLEKVRSIPLKVYEFAYDTVKGRRQLGVIGDELESILPESVDVVRSQAFKNPDNTKGSPALVKISNFPVVDKNVLFMYNVGAVQHLLKKQEELNSLVDQLEELEKGGSDSIKLLESRIDGEIEEQAVEEAAKVAASAALIRAEAEAVEVKATEDRLLLLKQAETERSTVDFESKLAEERLSAEDKRERERASEASALLEEVALRNEAQRRATELMLKAKQLEQDQVMEGERRVAELERVAAEAAAKASAERDNEDISLRRIQAEGMEERRRTLEAITAVFSHLGSGGAALLGDPKKLGTMLLSCLAVVAGGFLSREAATLARQLIEAKLGKPRLVRETSRASHSFIVSVMLMPFQLGNLIVQFLLAVISFLIGPVTWYQRFRYIFNLMFRRNKKEEVDSSTKKKTAAQLRSEEVLKHFEGVVLPESLLARIQQLAIATRNARNNRVPYRHLLLYGPPGTGKTMVAQRLAQASGMDYALMSGGDVGPLGKDAVTELHALFRWAKSSSTGLLLFIDEAEAFLGSRSRSAMSEELRNALNALLYQTGTQSYSFMMVLATNRAEDLDSAVIDRMDESLFLGLPQPDLRKHLVAQYFKIYVDSFTADSRRSKESRLNLRRLLRFILGKNSLIADLGLPPPLSIDFSESSSSALVEQNGKSVEEESKENGKQEKSNKSKNGANKVTQSSNQSLKAPLPAEVDLEQAKKECLDEVAVSLEGFSGREISKLMIAMQSVAYGSLNNHLSKSLFKDIVSMKIEEHKRKMDMVATTHASPKAREIPVMRSPNSK